MRIISKKVLLIMGGVILMGLGTAVCRQTNLGIDPYNALCVAVAQLTGMALGNVTLLGNLSLLVLVAVLAKRYIGIGTLVPMLSFGYLLQFFSMILPATTHWSGVSRLIAFSSGVLLIAFGMAVYMGGNLGMVAYDAIAFILHDWTRRPPFAFRVVLDLMVAGVAYRIGGPISIGTLILALGIGPLIDYFKRVPVARIYQHWAV